MNNLKEMKKDASITCSNEEVIEIFRDNNIILIKKEKILFSHIANVEDTLGYARGTIYTKFEKIMDMGVIDETNDLIVLKNGALQKYKKALNIGASSTSPLFVNISAIISSISQLDNLSDQNKKSAIKYLKECSNVVISQNLEKKIKESRMGGRAELVNGTLGSLKGISKNKRAHSHYLKRTYGVSEEDDFLLNRSRIYEKAERTKLTKRPGAYTSEEADMLSRQAKTDIVQYLCDEFDRLEELKEHEKLKDEKVVYEIVEEEDY